jgi:phytoene synthase
VSRTAERELDAAGILDPSLRRSYLTCRRLNAEHGKTYYLATLLLPPAKRPAVHALYGFARWVDDIIDEGTGPADPAGQSRVLDEVEALLVAPAATGHGVDDPPVVSALRDAMRRWDLPLSHLVDFLASMRMDLTVTEYETFADLERYMWGSAAVIGLLMLPVLQPVSPVAVAAPYAADLGVAFQLTNFLRDVGDDLRRGRIYLPMESLRRHGVDRARLERGVVDGPIRRLLADEIARTREIYRSAAPGVRLLSPDSRDCVRTALRLYGAILSEIERSGYRVLDRRVAVSRRQRAQVAIPGAVRALTARRGR